MRDEDRIAPGAEASDVETALGRLAAAAAPPGLRRRVLDRAREASGNAVLAPWMRVAAAASSVLIGLVLAVDPFIGRYVQARLAASIDLRPFARPASESRSELDDILAVGAREADRIVRLQALTAPAGRGETPGDLIEIYKNLKGWLDYETSEDPG